MAEITIKVGDCLVRRGIELPSESDEPWVVKIVDDVVTFITADDDTLRTMSMSKAKEEFVVVDNIQDDLEKYQ